MDKLFKWREAVISSYGPEPITRLVLLVLSLHMDRGGESCFPAIRTLMKETGLSNKSVIRHIHLAERAGWIEKEICGFSGKGWKRHSYKATIPAKILDQIISKGGVPATPRCKKEGGVSEGEGGVSEGIKVVNEVHTSSSYNSSKNSSNNYTSDSNEIRLSKLLLNLIRSRNPKFKNPDLRSWAKHIDRAIRLDNRSPDDLQEVIKWCQADQFWQNNILSTQKLREKFDQLFMQMGGKQNGTNRNNRRPGSWKNGGQADRDGKYSKVHRVISTE